jgi:hypothetical protein
VKVKVKVKMGALLADFEQAYLDFAKVYFESWRDYQGNEPWNDTEQKAYERWKKSLQLRYDHVARLSKWIHNDVRGYKGSVYEKVNHTTERATLLYMTSQNLFSK